MDHEHADLFEEFDASGRSSNSSNLIGEILVRPAVAADTDALGRISAARDGGDAHEHSSAFMRSLEDLGSEDKRLTLVAELGSDIIGFGKARYLNEEQGAGVGETPEGWYLTGVVVDPRFRRQGVGAELTAGRLQWIAERCGTAYYFANAKNRVSIALHKSFGFTEVARGAEFAGVSFAGGEGVLFRVDLGQPPRNAP